MLGKQTISAARHSQVSFRLFHYLGARPDESFPDLQLERDLGLQPLDLVLFVLAFEEADGLAFPFEELEHATTVRELVRLVAGFLTACDQRESLATDDELGFDTAAQ